MFRVIGAKRQRAIGWSKYRLKILWSAINISLWRPKVHIKFWLIFKFEFVTFWGVTWRQGTEVQNKSVAWGRGSKISNLWMTFFLNGPMYMCKVTQISNFSNFIRNRSWWYKLRRHSRCYRPANFDKLLFSKDFIKLRKCQGVLTVIYIFLFCI